MSAAPPPSRRATGEAARPREAASRDAAIVKDLATIWPEGPVEGPIPWARQFESLPRVSAAGGVFVVSDAHLPPEADPRTARFVAWCEGVLAAARRGEGPARVVCLGDLFDVWVGRCQLRTTGTGPVADALARLAAAGVACDLVPGNRDTLLDDAFEHRAGVTLRRDGLVLIDAAGAPAALCLHGDELCIREPGYLRLRRVMRARWFRALSRVAPLWFARAVGRRLRASYSGARGARHPHRGPQGDAARMAAHAAGVRLVLSGHSHAPADVALPEADTGPDAPAPSGAPAGPGTSSGRGVLGKDSVRWLTLGAFGDGADVAHLSALGELAVTDAAARR